LKKEKDNLDARLIAALTVFLSVKDGKQVYSTNLQERNATRRDVHRTRTNTARAAVAAAAAVTTTDKARR